MAERYSGLLPWADTLSVCFPSFFGVFVFRFGSVLSASVCEPDDCSWISGSSAIAETSSFLYSLFAGMCAVAFGDPHGPLSRGNFI